MDYRDIRAALTSKLGAYEDRQSDHAYYFLCIQGEEHRVGKLSHSVHGQALDFIVQDTAKRLKLTKPEFKKLVDCTISKDKYFQIRTHKELELD